MNVNTIINKDCVEVIKGLPDSSIDLILTDPPYGLGFGEYDNAENFYNLEDELYRVLKPNSFLVFYWSVKKLNEPFQRLKRFLYCWQIICYFATTYSKSMLGDRKYIPVLVFAKGAKPKVKSRDSDFVYAVELPVVDGKIGNALFKPTGATSQLLQMFSREGDLVLDPFCGFGSIPLCCKLWNRRFIGIEKDERVYKIAKKIVETGKVGYIGKMPGIESSKQLEFV